MKQQIGGKWWRFEEGEGGEMGEEKIEDCWTEANGFWRKKQKLKKEKKEKAAMEGD